MKSRRLALGLCVVACSADRVGTPSTSSAASIPSAPNEHPMDPPPPRECADAPMLARRHSARYRFDEHHAVRAVRVRVTPSEANADKNAAKGDGEIGFRGARYGFDFRLFDASGALVSAGCSQACFDHHARVPSIPGVYCLALTPLQADEHPTVEVDYAARMHGLGLVQMSDEDTRASIESVCGI